MKVAITGATGFVGSALAKALSAEGAEVIALARPTAQRDHLTGLPITWHVGDVTEPATLQGIFAGVDGLIHAAGMLGQAGVPEATYHHLHVQGTENVLAAAAAANLGRILYVSSPGVLGPISGPPAGETAPLAPSNPYERSKAAAEAVALRYAAAGLPVTIGRPEFIYGPGDRHVLGLFRAVQRGLFFYVSGGRHSCSPTYIDDAIAGLLRCFHNGRPAEIYHITGPRPVTFREFGTTIAAALSVRPPWLSLPKPIAWLGAAVLEGIGRLTGFTPPLTRTAVAFFSEDRRFSWQRAYHDLGYTPQVELTDGVQRTVAWYRQQGWLS
jgi:nucleoside-diphosphate-sugar epimerase